MLKSISIALSFVRNVITCIIIVLLVSSCVTKNNIRKCRVIHTGVITDIVYHADFVCDENGCVEVTRTYYKIDYNRFEIKKHNYLYDRKLKKGDTVRIYSDWNNLPRFCAGMEGKDSDIIDAYIKHTDFTPLAVIKMVFLSILLFIISIAIIACITFLFLEECEIKTKLLTLAILIFLIFLLWSVCYLV